VYNLLSYAETLKMPRIKEICVIIQLLTLVIVGFIVLYRVCVGCRMFDQITGQ